MPLYNDEGEEVEGALTPEEVAELKAKTEELEEKAKKAEELETTLKQKEEELSKLSNKDLNFKRLRDKSEEEINAWKKTANAREQELLAEVLETGRERDAEKQKRMEEVKNDVLKSLAGDDESLRKSIEVAEQELVGTAATAKEMEERYRKAYILAKGSAPSRNPLYGGYSSSYSEPDTSKKDFTETDAGKDAVKAWFPELAGKILPKDK